MGLKNATTTCANPCDAQKKTGAEAGPESSICTLEVFEGFQASHSPVGLLTTPTPDLSSRSVPLTEASAQFIDNTLTRRFKAPFRRRHATIGFEY